MIRKIVVSVVLIAAALGGALGLASFLVMHRPAPAQVERSANAPLVTTVVLAPEDAVDMLYGYGTARADLEATLRAEVGAVVVELVGNLKEGSSVHRGDVLVRLDERQYQEELNEARSRKEAADAELAQIDVQRRNQLALLEIAEAELNLNRDELDRVQALHNEGNAPDTEVRSMRLRFHASLAAKQRLENEIALLEPKRLRLKADRSAAEAGAQRAELNIERCGIKAPFDGGVDELFVKVGDKVQIGTQVLRLINNRIIEVPVELPVADRPRTMIGARVTLRVESMNDAQWHGVVGRIAPSADARSRTFEAYVEVDNAEQAIPLLPGYFVKADVEGPVLAGALVVPRSAVIDGQVFVMNGHAAHGRPVRVDRFIGERAVITGDVLPGDMVITSNLDTLYDGAVVRAAGEAGTAGAGGSTVADVEGGRRP